MNTPTPNKGQQKAADDFFSFLMSRAKTFGISGPPGVGKTFLMGYVSNLVMQLYQDACKLYGIPVEYDEVVFTATTNKAAEVLEKTLGRPVKTIQFYLGLKVKENWKTGKTTLEKTNRWKIHRRQIVFIDEASMIDTSLYNVIMESFEDSKIVFVGDHAQMAPVGESLSEVYVQMDPANLAILDEPVRNAGSPALMDLCNQLRETVETGVFYPIPSVPGTIDYLDDNETAAALLAHFSQPDPSARILCHTNARVKQFNEYVRKDVRMQPDHFEPGDIAVVAQPFARGKTFLSVERELTVSKVGPIQEDSSYDDLLDKPFQYRLIDFDGYSDIPVPVDPDIFSGLTRYFAQKKNWAIYFELKGRYADLRDKAACTIYKSQGSTYDTVFVDIGNIGTAFDPEQVARMLFVAISRARSRVCLYGQLPGKYINSRGQSLWTTPPTTLAS